MPNGVNSPASMELYTPERIHPAAITYMHAIGISAREGAANQAQKARISPGLGFT